MMDGNTVKDGANRDTVLDQEVPRVAVYETTDTNANDARARYDATVEAKDDDRSPDEIEHDIEQTQERIADSIDELARRLSPTNIKDQAVQSLNESLNIPGLKHLIGDMRGNAGDGARAVGAKVLEGVKHNFLSSALVGVGLGLAAVGGIVAARTDTTQVNTSHTPARKNMKSRTYDERLRGMMETIENKDNYVNEDSKTSGKLESAKAMVSEGVHQAKEATVHGAQRAKEVTMHGAQRAKDGLSHVLEAQPLAIGAVALLAGAAVGLLLPRTRYEDSFMGEKSDQLISQAKGKASEVVEVAKSTVSDVLQTAKDTAGEVVQTAKDTARETVKVATA